MPKSNRIARYRAKLDLPKGKTILISGANSGIGFEVAKALAKDNRLIFAVRNKKKGEEAKTLLSKDYPPADILLMDLDLSSLESIRSFCDKIKQEKLDIDAFYCNAGIYRVPFQTVYGDIESQVGVNAVSSYILYKELRDYLHSLPHPVKFLLTSSIAARFISFDVPSDFRGENYDKVRAYSKSKLAVNAFYRFLLKEEKESNILPLLVHPGISFTPLIEKAYSGKRWLLLAKRFLRAFFNKPEKAALSPLCALQDKVDQSGFYGPRGIGHASGYPTAYPLYAKNLKNEADIVAFMEDLYRRI